MRIPFGVGIVAMLLMAAEVQGALPVTKIASGCEANQSYFLTSDGRLWGTGVSIYSQTGLELPIDTYFNRPEQILMTNVTAVASGGSGFNYMLAQTDCPQA